ncbi:hypothetical protein [Streptomyces huasconensis]|uniref:hypothetical protein n=1 Tax=Streptomyces huasconensis TaxID=1854574 RepID=UPI0036F8FB71
MSVFDEDPHFRPYMTRIRRSLPAALVMLLLDVATGIAIALTMGLTWWLVLIVISGLAAGVTFLSAARTINAATRIRPLPVLVRREQLKDQTYVLYLRNFQMDQVLSRVDEKPGRGIWSAVRQYFGDRDNIETGATAEEQLVRLFRRFGKVVAVGSPGESFTLPGAERFYLPEDDWKGEVSDAIRHARLVLIIAGLDCGSRTPEGVLWEYTEALRLLPPSRVLLLACSDSESYGRFCEEASNFYTARAGELRATGVPVPAQPSLPPYPPLMRPSKPHRRMPVEGIVRFKDDASGEFVRFDPTSWPGLTRRARQRTMVTTQIDPLLEHIEEALPGKARYTAPVNRARVARTTARILLGVTCASLLLVEAFDITSPSQLAGIFIFTFTGSAWLTMEIMEEERSRQIGDVKVVVPEEGGNAVKGITTTKPSPLPATTEPRSRQLTEEPPATLSKGERTLNRTMRRWQQVNVVIMSVVMFLLLWTRPALPVILWSSAIGVVLIAVNTAHQLRKLGRFVAYARRPSDLKQEPYVLYLRPMPLDVDAPPLWSPPGLKEALMAVFASYGTLIVSGDRADLDKAGIPRLPLTPGKWKPEVSEALPYADLVLIMATSSPGTLWQLTEAVRLLSPAQLLVIVPGGKDAAECYERFKAAAETEFARRIEELRNARGADFSSPRFPDIPHTAARGQREPALCGVIYFTRAWQPGFLRLDPSPTGDDQPEVWRAQVHSLLHSELDR